MKHYNRQISFIVGVATFCAVAAANVSAATIKGNVRYSGARVEKKTFPVTIDQYLCGKEKEAGDLMLSSANGIRNVVVSLHGVPIGSKAPAPPVPAKMDQKQCVFVPRVIVVPVGGTVEFLNSDRLLHNVRGGGKENPPFNRAQPHARTIAIGFKSPEVLRVDCDIHSWMRGWIVVAEHPFYAVTNDEGEFVFENIPPGKYKLQAWQEILGRVDQEVAVSGEGTQTITVRMEKK
ncbi:MAG: carboxypeptidase regulatory-like domain-containing protein [Pyrinomonadaceae bacterium]|nr:carboxypeptidase regulatory-like domain-containing protein [Pyrinomonadaceae bacterium]